MALIEVLNDSGSVLIDDEYSNLVLATKGTVSFSGNVATIDYSSADGAMPLLAIRSSFYVALFSIARPSSSIYRFTLYKATDEPGASVDYFLFHLPHAVQSAGGIVQLFNAQGRLVFDSNLKYFRMAMIDQITDMAGRSWALPSGRSYAVCAPCPVYSSVNAPVGPQPPPNVPYLALATAYGYRVANNLIQGGQVTVFASSSICPNGQCGWQYFNLNASMMVVDVTGF